MSVTGFVLMPPARDILRNLRHARKLRKCANLAPTFPPHPQVALQQLLTKHTSFPFHSLSRRQRDHRIAPSTHAIASMKRKLCLPIINPAPVSLQRPCRTTPDICGDHYFHCKSPAGHKANPHNCMRDTLLHIFRTLIGAGIRLFVDWITYRTVWRTYWIVWMLRFRLMTHQRN